MTARRVPGWALLGLVVHVCIAETDLTRVPFLTNRHLLVGALFSVLPIPFLALRSTALAATLRRPALALLAAYLCWVTVATTWSIDPHAGGVAMTWMVSSAVFATWFVTVHGWEAFRRSLAIATAVFVLECVVVHLARGDSGRLRGYAYGYTNVGFAGGVLVLLALSLPRTGRWARVERWSGVALGAAAVAFSSTRTVGIGLVVVAAYVQLHRHGRRGALGALAVLTTAGAIGVLALASGVVSLDDGTAGSDPGSGSGALVSLGHSPNADDLRTATGRTNIWRLSIDMIEQRPIFGFGTGSASRVFDEITRSGRLGWHAYGTHNSFLGLLLAQGAVGLVLFTAACAAHVAAARRLPDTTRTALLLLLFVDGLTETLFDSGRLALLVLAGAFASVAVAREALPRTARSPRTTLSPYAEPRVHRLPGTHGRQPGAAAPADAAGAA